MKTKFYALEIWGDVEPKLHGPYASELARDTVARRIREDEGDETGVYRLDQTGPRLEVAPYSGGEMETDLAEHEGCECAHCSRVILPGEEARSTYCGSMHQKCFPPHARRCGACHSD